jgi:hypothetical protein
MSLTCGSLPRTRSPISNAAGHRYGSSAPSRTPTLRAYDDGDAIANDGSAQSSVYRELGAAPTVESAAGHVGSTAYPGLVYGVVTGRTPVSVAGTAPATRAWPIHPAADARGQLDDGDSRTRSRSAELGSHNVQPVLQEALFCFAGRQGHCGVKFASSLARSAKPTQVVRQGGVPQM